MRDRLHKLLPKQVIPILALISIVLLFAGLAYFFSTRSPIGSVPEVAILQSKPMSFEQYSTYFRTLAQNKGAEYAFTVLRQARFPDGIDIHLLGHVVGDILYKQKGLEGIKICTPDFRNACSHSIVIGLLLERGESALDDIARACREAPGGKGAYTMCFHGLGHGILAFTDYNLEKAVALCKKTGTPEFQNREYPECVGGTVMEMIAGVHDHIAWEKQSPKYFTSADPLTPCDSAFMPQEARAICYTYLTPHLFTSAGADLGSPDPKYFPKAFSYCDKIPENDTEDRNACYGGFGKEFIVLAQGRDIRDMGSMEAPALGNVRAWCAMAGSTPGEGACNGNALASLFWGGENKPDAAFTYCAIAVGKDRDQCYSGLLDTVSFYLSGNPKGYPICSRFPDPFKGICLSRISS